MQNTSLSLCTAGYLLRIVRCGGTRWCGGGGWERSAQAAGTAEGGNWKHGLLLILHFYYSRWLGNRKYKKANTINVASGSVFNKTMAQWRFLFLPSGHWHWSHIRHYLGRVQWTKYTLCTIVKNVCLGHKDIRICRKKVTTETSLAVD